MRVHLALAALALLACASRTVSEPQSGIPSGTNGMVSTGHAVATEAGLAVLRDGGNAFDAAVAIAATLNVAEPMMSGIGGYGTILTYDARSNRVRFLNASSRIPQSLNSDVYREPTPNFRANRTGAKAVSTPGNVHAWEAMSKEYGTRPWRGLFDAAIIAAERGVTVSPRIAGLIASAYADFPAHAKAFYGRDGKPLTAGEVLVQRDLARTLRASPLSQPQNLYVSGRDRVADLRFSIGGVRCEHEDSNCETHFQSMLHHDTHSSSARQAQ